MNPTTTAYVFSRIENYDRDLEPDLDDIELSESDELLNSVLEENIQDTVIENAQLKLLEIAETTNKTVLPEHVEQLTNEKYANAETIPFEMVENNNQSPESLAA